MKLETKKVGVAILISEKDFKGHNKRHTQKRPPHNTEIIDPTRGYNPCKHYAPNVETPKIYMSKILVDFGV